MNLYYPLVSASGITYVRVCILFAVSTLQLINRCKDTDGYTHLRRMYIVSQDTIR